MLTASRLNSADYKRNVWVAQIEGSVPFDDLKKPIFWAHVADRLRPWDIIEVRSDIGAFFAQLVVTDVAKARAEVAVVSFIQLSARQVEDPGREAKFGQYTIKHRGPKYGWCVIRDEDRAVMNTERLNTQEAAMAWAHANLKVAA